MRTLRYVAVLIVAVGLSLTFGVATTKAKAAAGNLSQSYKATGKIAPGSLVSLKSARSHYVTATTTKNGDRLVGVVVAPHNSLLAVDSQKGAVQVALSGVVPVLVSTLNGQIANGDRVAVSALSGVGMKALPGSRIIGIAQASFNRQAAHATARTVHKKSGQSKQVSVGYVPVAIAIGSVPQPGDNNSLLGLHNLASGVVGHQVSTLSIVISAVVALVGLVSLAALVFGTIRGSLVSIGRNPLAKPAIFQSLLQVLAMALLIVVLSMVTIYLTLR
jgi:hypothetical protein